MKLPLLALLTAGLALTADAAHAAPTVGVEQRTLVIAGGSGNDKLVLRARGRRLVVAGSAVARRRFDRIRVRAGSGSDRVRIEGSIRRTPITIEGGRGADTLLGGRGNERLFAGSGNDVVDGGRGKDRALLGPGDDRFAWSAGDGDDTVDGADGRDVLTFGGSRADEAFRVSPDGDRVRLVRDVGGVVMSLGALEQVAVSARGGADTLTTDELAATTLQAVSANLGGGDAATDRVIANATNFDDAIQVSGADGAASIAGLTVPLTMAGAEPGDQLRVNALAGFDLVSSALAPTTLALVADGGADDDVLTGGPAAETLVGGDGHDAVDGNQGDDGAVLGAGDDLFTWDAGDGSDAVAGDAGVDTMSFNGSGADERFALSADGRRVRFTRDVGGVAMDLDDVERIAAEAAGGADALTAGDMSGTDLTALRIALGTDGAGDAVTVDASGGDDAVTVSGVAGAANLTGLPNGLMVSVAGAQAADDTLVVNTLAGRDAVNASGLPAATLRLTVDGGAADDVLSGGAGPDVLLGGDGHDAVDGKGGEDVALLGAGDDTFTWDPGDGNDTIEGQAGADTMRFNGSGTAEAFDAAANGLRVRFTRNVGNIVMDLDDVERIDTVALGGADVFTANDLSGTDVAALDVALGTDGVADDVFAVGSNGDDVALATGGAGSATLTGLSSTLTITGAQAPADRLSVSLLAGDDLVDASGLAASGVAFRSEGGNGEDVLIGSDGADVLRGDGGDDVLRGGPGTDDLDGGAGNNIVVQD